MLLSRLRQSVSSIHTPKGPKLGDIMKVQLVAKLPAQKIAELWKEYYSGKANTVGGAISGSGYQRLVANMRECPTFVVPTGLGGGAYLNFLFQFGSERSVLGCSLEKVKRWGLAAQPDLVLTFFSELAASHNLVLHQTVFSHGVVGQPQSETPEKQLMATLVDNLVEFYLDYNLFKRFVIPFNKYPHEFSFDELVAQHGHRFKLN